MKILLWLALGLLSLGACVVESGPCKGVKEIPKTECEALVSFYEATDGPQWKDNRGWLQTNTPCSWHGLQCTEGHVTGLSINYNEVSGYLPGFSVN